MTRRYELTDSEWSIIAPWMRHAQKRTVEDTWRHIGGLLQTIPANECNNYFLNSERFLQNVNRF
jgi:hypothetical protein